MQEFYLLLECNKSDGSTNSNFKILQEFDKAIKLYEEAAEEANECRYADFAIELYRLTTLIGVSVDFDEDAVIFVKTDNNNNPISCVATWNTNGDKDRINKDGSLYEQKDTDTDEEA